MAQTTSIIRTEPPFWWVNMQQPQLQLLVYGPKIGTTTPQLQADQVQITAFHSTTNPNYLFIDLHIAPGAPAQTLSLTFHKDNEPIARKQYPLKAREDHTTNGQQGFNSSDVIYLLMPDRFANGQPDNDQVAGMKEGPNRNDQYGRHGGDLAGVRQHLDYIKKLGATALWMTPVLENDMPRASYHGYAITDYYSVDARLGTNQEYKALVDEAHDMGLKVIQDMVFNHCGLEHWFIQDKPTPDWVHQFPEFTYSNYRNSAAVDPYAAPADKKLHGHGWFDTSMPDLNQEQPFLATYLIQNSIWWIEYLGIDGIRMDTYPFPDKNMMAEWARRIRQEFPAFNIVGESWMELPATTAYWQHNSPHAGNYESYLPSVTDFPLRQAIIQALTEKDGWTTGLARIYYTLVQDMLYDAPGQNLIFLDNHDLSRIYTELDSNYNALRMATAVLLTTRGIPQLYYGTEILMDGDKAQGDGLLRQDFPGGWPGDARTAFIANGRTPEEQQAYTFFQRMLNWRQKQPAIHHGQLTQYIPENGFYVYFRHNSEQTIMVVLNNQTTRTLPTQRFHNFLKGFSQGYDVVFDEPLHDLSEIAMPAKSARVIVLE